MESLRQFKGVIPPISTIFTQDGSVDKAGMRVLIDSLIESGVHGLFFLGTGGEFSQMSVAERLEVADFAVSYVNKRVPVLIGTGSTSTSEAIYLSQCAQSIGADGVVIINPYYWKLNEEHLFSHYSDIADSIKIPILLYNFPNLTGQDITPDLVCRLVEKHSNIVGIKDTIDSIGHINEMIIKVKTINPQFSIFCGFDNHLLNTLQLGGDGIISAGGNFASELAVKLYESFSKGDLDNAIKIQRKLSIFPELYKIDVPFVNVVKEATKLVGPDISTYVLPPLRKLSDEKIEQVKEILKVVELL